jgi:malonate-semialdehyde dehydrogenase (acetylating) / methylmalonate-semialdehyde dehydrogenase
VAKKTKNYINGEWVASKSTNIVEVTNPATGEILADEVLSTPAEANAAVEAAQEAYWEWRETPPYTRARYMFRLKDALEERFEEIARTVTMENGKNIDEARGEVRRAIENVEVACGIPSLMMGYNLEDVATGIDEDCIRQPMGVFCGINPFNFPAMVPMWFIPYALATGNTYVVKPSRQTPLTMNIIMDVFDECDFPPGVLNLVNGTHDVTDALLTHPLIKGASFVGSTPAGLHVYKTATAHGKRAQCQGGAKNFMVAMPDADIPNTVGALMTSCYGCAGQRCLAGSVILCVGDVYEKLRDATVAAASKIRVGYGLDEGVQMGPVISAKSKQNILNYVDSGIKEGAKLILDGRGIQVAGYPNGHFVGPTVFENVTPKMKIVQEEVFGPVVGFMQVESFEEALDIIHGNPFGNAASIFTGSGKWAREFKYRVQAGNIGINVGIAAPIASFPFAGMKDSFFGDLHGQGQDGINFFTDRKVVISRWF